MSFDTFHLFSSTTLHTRPDSLQQLQAYPDNVHTPVKSVFPKILNIYPGNQIYMINMYM